MKQYKTCNGCKALTHSIMSRNGSMVCSLGYQTTIGKEIMNIVVETKPVESCPKPKTNNDLMECYKHLRKN